MTKSSLDQSSNPCYHQCTSNCRRNGCNCECGPWHEDQPSTPAPINAFDMCRCEHPRHRHGPSQSINYTEGRCSECACEHFVMP